MTIRALVVDDSPTMQNLISAVLTSDAQIEVVGKASCATEAREMIKKLNPDVITLDVEMPGMDGLEFLRRLMQLRPMPVVMISSWTRKGTDASIAALQVGAFACHAKPRMDNEAELRAICETIKAAAGSKTAIANRGRAPAQPAAATRAPNAPVSIASERRARRKVDLEINMRRVDLIAIGSSTGGVEALTTVLTGFPADCPPVVITQHMPKGFTSSFAERLDRSCAPKVRELSGTELLKRGEVYLAPGSVGHMHIAAKGQLKATVVEGEPVSGHMPSVDFMFDSIAKADSLNAIGIILTGMGSDGAKGMLAMKNGGATTISQSKETCLVYGMPAAAEKIGASDHVIDLDKISAQLFNSNPRENQYVSA